MGMLIAMPMKKKKKKKKKRRGCVGRRLFIRCASDRCADV
jgi:hypothetical protein